MSIPFPGMDPYLESPRLWQDVHTRLIAAIGNDLGPRLSPRYVVSVEERTYIAAAASESFLGRPDVVVAGLREPPPSYSVMGGVAVVEPFTVQVPMADELTERYLEIRDAEYGFAITIIELLSPDNKRAGSRGNSEYLSKRETIISSRTNLVEIDLLRGGTPSPIIGPTPVSDYRIVVIRSWERPLAKLYPFDLRDPIPTVPIPLRRGEEEPLLALNQLLHRLYEQAVYNLRIDYSHTAIPPLAEADAVWAAALLAGRQTDR